MTQLPDTEYLRVMLQEATIAMALYTGMEMTIAFANKLILDAWGKDDSVIGKTFDEALPELADYHFMDTLRNVYTTGVPYEAEQSRIVVTHRNTPKTFYYSFSFKPLRNADSTISGILNSAQDVMERVIGREATKRLRDKEDQLSKEQTLNEELAATNEELSAANEELHLYQAKLEQLNSELEKRVASRTKDIAESEKRFRSMAENANVMISVNDSAGNIEYVDPAWLSLTGSSMQRMREEWSDLLHPDDKEAVQQEYKDGIESKAPFTLEFRMMNRNGEPRWIYTKVNPRLSAKGNYIGTVSSSIDVTERRQQQEELLEVNSRLNIAIDAGSFGSTEVDLSTGSMICNARFKKLFGTGADEELYLPANVRRHASRIPGRDPPPFYVCEGKPFGVRG